MTRDVVKLVVVGVLLGILMAMSTGCGKADRRLADVKALRGGPSRCPRSYGQEVVR